MTATAPSASDHGRHDDRLPYLLLIDARVPVGVKPLRPRPELPRIRERRLTTGTAMSPSSSVQLWANYSEGVGTVDVGFRTRRPDPAHHLAVPHQLAASMACRS